MMVMMPSARGQLFAIYLAFDTHRCCSPDLLGGQKCQRETNPHNQLIDIFGWNANVWLGLRLMF